MRWMERFQDNNGVREEEFVRENAREDEDMVEDERPVRRQED